MDMLRVKLWIRSLGLISVLMSSLAFSQSANTAFEDEIVSLVNQERAKEGLKPLKVSRILSTTAREHSHAMATGNFFGHCNPDTQTSPSNRAQANGYPQGVGENIAIGSSSPEAVMSLWMESPGHRANILRASYTEIGIGYIYDENDQANTNRVNADCTRGEQYNYAFRHYWTQVFGSADTAVETKANIEADISGLSGTLVVRVNNQNVQITQNGQRTLLTSQILGESYTLSLVTVPSHLVCQISTLQTTVSEAIEARITCSPQTSDEKILLKDSFE